MVATWLQYTIPPIMIAVIVFIKNTVGDKSLPEDPRVWIDVFSNVFGFLFSKTFIEKGVDMFHDATFLRMGFDIVMEPLVHGSLNGVLRRFSYSSISIGNIESQLFQRGLSGGLASLTHRYTFMDGFKEGALYNIMGNYFAGPLEWAL